MNARLNSNAGIAVLAMLFVGTYVYHKVPWRGPPLVIRTVSAEWQGPHDKARLIVDLDATKSRECPGSTQRFITDQRGVVEGMTSPGAPMLRAGEKPPAQSFPLPELHPGSYFFHSVTIYVCDDATWTVTSPKAPFTIPPHP